MNVLTTGIIFTLVQLVVASLAQTCGQRKFVVQESILVKNKVKARAWPWYGALLYDDSPGRPIYNCGVTVLAKRFVISSAHCTIWFGYEVPAQEYLVWVGVTALDSPNWSHVQEHRAARIIRHEEYNKKTLENDISLLELYTNITYNDYVQPVCLWQDDTSLSKVVSEIGNLVGWSTSEKGQRTLNDIPMSIVSEKGCINSDCSRFMLPLFEKTTFCAGYRNGTTAARGYGESGLFLRFGNNWVLRGILSTAKQGSDGNVNSTSCFMFMDVLKYANWIKKYLTVTKNNAQKISSDRNISKFIDEEERQKCGQQQNQKLISTGFNASSGSWPWHGALFYSLKNGQTFYSCGVTIVTKRFVITAATCTLDSNKLQIQALYIQVGLTNLISPKQHAQQHKIAKIIQHDKFDNATYENNIALIELYTDISYNDYIQPICLWQTDTNLRKVVSQIGYIVSWGDTEKNLVLPQVLNEVAIMIVSQLMCFLTFSFSAKFNSEPTTFCGKIRNETHLSPKDTGAGLFFKDNNRWVLQGILSFGQFNSTTNDFGYMIFTGVSEYIEWISNVTNKSTPKEQIVPQIVANTTETNFSSLVEVTTEFKKPHKCGQKTNEIDVRESMSKEYKALPGAWPWHGAMFNRLMGGKTSFACGVTILTEWFVITAATCTIELAAQLVYVKVGLTNLNSSEPQVQHHEVIRIIQHKGFNKTTYKNNIALIELRTVISYNDYVQPICLWEDDSELRNIESQVGYAAGWRDFENDLNEVTMTPVSETDCYLNDTDFFSSFYFESKTFCAEFDNAANLSSKYVGGGLFLIDDNSWVLRGILSYGKINSTTNDFDLESYVILTNVSNYIDWIKLNTIKTTNNVLEIEQIHASNVKPVETTNTNNSTFVEVTKESKNPKKCGQRKFDVRKLIFNGYKTLPGAWPWHGAMFHRLMGGQTSYACGVTVLSERFVITAAHCTIDKQEGQRLPADRAYIKLGLTNLDSPERHVQQHSVASIIRHEEYDEVTFENDISLLKLHAEITYSDYVQPVCLWQGDVSLKHIVSEIGYTVGWGYNEHFGLPKDLNEATMPIVSRKDCIDSDHDYFRKVYFEPKTFCAGYRNGSSAAPGDSAGGLFLRQGSSWVLRGIISNTKSDPNTLLVDPKSFVVFVDVSYYLDWIKSKSVDVSIAQTDSVNVTIAQKDFSGSKMLLICLVAGLAVVLLVALSCNICRIKNCKVNLNCARTRGDANRNTYLSYFVKNG